MKKILTILLGVLAVGFAGCLKDTRINTNGLDTTTPIVELTPIAADGTLTSGLENFSKATVLTAGVTTNIVVPVTINLTNVLTKDVTVTLAISDAARTAYNTANASGPQYLAMPDSCISFATKTAVIKAGTQLATVNITFYPTKVDPSKNYMAVVSITDAQGTSISGNFGTFYLHTIGNPLAGNYTSLYNRWNNATGTGSPTTVTAGSLVGLPDDPTTVNFQSGYGAQNGVSVRYKLTFTNTAGVLSNFAVQINPTDVTNGLQGTIGVLSFTDATIILADGVNKHFKFTYAVVNGAGAPRTFTDEYTHQ
jgi:hypothetical protein